MQITVRLLASYRRYLPKDHDIQAGYVHDVPPTDRSGTRSKGEYAHVGLARTLTARQSSVNFLN